MMRVRWESNRDRDEKYGHSKRILSPEVEPGAQESIELREFQTLARLDVDKFDRMKKKVEGGIRCWNRLATWPRRE